MKLPKVHRPSINWRKYGELSPVDEIPEDVLVKIRWTFANGESLISEIPGIPTIRRASVCSIENDNTMTSLRGSTTNIEYNSAISG